MSGHRTIKVALSPAQIEALEALGGGDAERALHELAARCVDGVFRPGSWERSWVLQAFGHDWLEQLERDPATPWRERRKP
jgi:hypothetical protein